MGTLQSSGESDSPCRKLAENRELMKGWRKGSVFIKEISLGGFSETCCVKGVLIRENVLLSLEV